MESAIDDRSEGEGAKGAKGALGEGEGLGTKLVRMKSKGNPFFSFMLGFYRFYDELWNSVSVRRGAERFRISTRRKGEIACNTPHFWISVKNSFNSNIYDEYG